MFKKTMLLAVSAAALAAFALPTVASAQQLTEGGSPLLKNAEITATSTNLVTTVAGLGELTCAKVTVHAKVNKNTAANSEAESLAPHTVGGVTTSTGVTTESCDLKTVNGTVDAASIHDATAKASFFIEKSGSGTATATFVVTTLSLECHFATNAGSPLTLTYMKGTDSVHVSGGLVGTPAPPCPSSATIAGDFTLETADGTPVIID